METPVGELGVVTQQVKAYQNDLKDITQGNLEDVQNIPETIEQQATKLTASMSCGNSPACSISTKQNLRTSRTPTKPGRKW